MSSPYVKLGNRSLDQWKVTELKEELKRRRLPIKGLKEDLVKRLDEAVRVEMANAAEEADNASINTERKELLPEQATVGVLVLESHKAEDHQYTVDSTANNVGGDHAENIDGDSGPLEKGNIVDASLVHEAGATRLVGEIGSGLQDSEVCNEATEMKVKTVKDGSKPDSNDQPMKYQRSLAEELYSEAMQLSSVALDRGSTPTPIDDSLSDQDPDDFWCNDESSCEDSVDKSNNLSDMDREWQKRRYQFHTIGYRDGLIAGKETSAQEGFNIGFKCSVSAGYNWGLVRGVTSAMACLLGELKAKLVETEETIDKFKSLHEAVQSISTNDALKLFYEDHQRKSLAKNKCDDPLHPTTNDSVHHNPDSGVLDNYYGQLQSVLEEAPLINSSKRTI